jgi:protein SCO1/2
VPEVTVVEHLGEQVSFDTEFVDSEGETVRMGDYLGRGHPVILNFAYHSCPMLCSLVLDGLSEALRETDMEPGLDFEVVSLSFNHREGPERAAEAKAMYVERTIPAKPDIAENWHFLTGQEENIRTLADEVGFEFVWDEETQQYAHNAILVFISPDGTITRYLYGIEHNPRDFRLATVEAGQGTVGSTLDRFLLTCFRYDTTSRSYTPYILNIMKIGGVLSLLALAAFFLPMWLRERKRGNEPATFGPDAGLAD